jgi:hypothetical protein
VCVAKIRGMSGLVLMPADTCRYTTLHYRPPEMCDVHSGHVIDTKVDVWAMGCALCVCRAAAAAGGEACVCARIACVVCLVHAA